MIFSSINTVLTAIVRRSGAAPTQYGHRDVLADLFPDAQEHFETLKGKRSAERAQVAQAAERLQIDLSALASKHGQAIKSCDCTRSHAAARIDAIEKQLVLGQRMVLQHSDATWGSAITDRALRTLKINVLDFRWNIRSQTGYGA